MFVIRLHCLVSWQRSLARDKASGTVAPHARALLPVQQRAALVTVSCRLIRPPVWQRRPGLRETSITLSLDNRQERVPSIQYWWPHILNLPK